MSSSWMNFQIRKNQRKSQKNSEKRKKLRRIRKKKRRNQENTQFLFLDQDLILELMHILKRKIDQDQGQDLESISYFSNIREKKYN